MCEQNKKMQAFLWWQGSIPPVTKNAFIRSISSRSMCCTTFGRHTLPVKLSDTMPESDIASVPSDRAEDAACAPQTTMAGTGKPGPGCISHISPSVDVTHRLSWMHSLCHKLRLNARRAVERDVSRSRSFARRSFEILRERSVYAL